MNSRLGREANKGTIKGNKDILILIKVKWRREAGAAGMLKLSQAPLFSI